MFFRDSYDLRRAACCVVLIACGFAFGCGADAPPEDPGPTAANGALPDAGPGGNAPPPAGAGGAAGSVNPIGGATPPPVPPPPMPPDRRTDPCTVQAMVMFVIDGSGSMCEEFGGSTRWQELRSALLDPNDGLIYVLQAFGAFGMLLYDGTIDMVLAMGAAGSTPMCAMDYVATRAEGECPQFIEVQPDVNNAAAIDAAFPQTELGGSTPTDKAINRAVDVMIALQEAGLDTRVHPQYIILATDGAPNDICVGGVGGDGSLQQQGVIDAVDRGAAAGVTTFVISLAGRDNALQAHLDEVARHGRPNDPNASTFSPSSPEELVTTLRAWLDAALGCVG